MKEPKFSDAPCYGIEFNANSKVCRVCIANRSCQRIFYKAGGPRHMVNGASTLKVALPLHHPPKTALLAPLANTRAATG